MMKKVTQEVIHSFLSLFVGHSQSHAVGRFIRHTLFDQHLIRVILDMVRFRYPSSMSKCVFPLGNSHTDQAHYNGSTHQLAINQHNGHLWVVNQAECAICEYVIQKPGQPLPRQSRSRNMIQSHDAGVLNRVQTIPLISYFEQTEIWKRRPIHIHTTPYYLVVHCGHLVMVWNINGTFGRIIDLCKRRNEYYSADEIKSIAINNHVDGKILIQYEFHMDMININDTEWDRMSDLSHANMYWDSNDTYCISQYNQIIWIPPSVSDPFYVLKVPLEIRCMTPGFSSDHIICQTEHDMVVEVDYVKGCYVLAELPRHQLNGIAICRSDQQHYIFVLSLMDDCIYVFQSHFNYLQKRVDREKKSLCSCHIL